ncbi:MAG: hypothetical protein DHS20C17_09830 [Cyclobacteriaceae bacterium]|nr:MAG: hypothetical protein DHS20C17_09830 [Cyclobacteriaceae bacterium]
MKKITLPTGGFIFAITTLALLPLLIVTACENDDVSPVIPGPLLSFNTDTEVRVVAGEAATVRPTFRPLTIAPVGTTWSWKIISVPENSRVSLTSTDQSEVTLETDIPGKYQLELTGKLGLQVIVDTLVVKAYDETTLQGQYQLLVEADGPIYDLYGYQNKLYAAGGFQTIGGVKAPGIAFYNETGWKPLGLGMEPGAYVADMIEFQGDLYVVGYFSGPQEVTSPAVSRWDGTAWNAVPGLEVLWVQNDWGPLLVNSGTSLQVYKDNLYIGGYFRGRNLGSLQDYSVLKLDGNQLTGVLRLFNSLGNSGIRLEEYNGQLVAFNQYDKSISLFDGTVWQHMDIPIDANRYSYNMNAVHYKNKLLINTKTAIPQFQEEQVISDFFIWDQDQFQEVYSPNNFMHTLEVVGEILFTGETNGIFTWDGQRWGVSKEGPKFSIDVIESFQNQLFVAGTMNEGIYQIAVWQPLD